MFNTFFSGKSLWVLGGVVASFFAIIGLWAGIVHAASAIPVGSFRCGATQQPPSTCVGNEGQSCTSRANACGATGQGSISCDGTCSASVPALPSNLNQTCTSGANSCGQTNSGTITCSGTCSATAPADSSCPASYGWSSAAWGTCGSSCTQTRAVTCVNQSSGGTVADSYCTAAKPGTSQSCTGGSCRVNVTVFGDRLDGLSSYVCQGQSSAISSVQMPAGKTLVSCSYDYEAPYNRFNGGGPQSSWNESTRTCSAWFNCYGGVTGGACGPTLGWCNDFNARARLTYY